MTKHKNAGRLPNRFFSFLIRVVRSFMRNQGLLLSGAIAYYTHAKTLVIDGVWSTGGSTNMDFWSFSSNNEVNAVVLNREFAVEMEKMFARDLAESDEVRWQEWKKRPLSLKVTQWFSHLFARWR